MLVWAAAAKADRSGSEPKSAPTLRFTIAAVRPHDQTAFTQGLAFDGDTVIESTGLYGKSTLTVRDRETGRLIHRKLLAPGEFGEGVAVTKDRIVQLTWRNGLAHFYDRTLRKTGSCSIESEGWGLAFDGVSLFQSDGTSTIRVLDPDTCKKRYEFEVRDGGRAIQRINELEFIDGFIYANIWQSDWVAVIDSETGEVGGWLNLEVLKLRLTVPCCDPGNTENVLNGIAYDSETKRIWVTGKRWSQIFELNVDTRDLPAP